MIFIFLYFYLDPRLTLLRHFCVLVILALKKRVSTVKIKKLNAREKFRIKKRGSRLLMSARALVDSKSRNFATFVTKFPGISREIPEITGFFRKFRDFHENSGGIPGKIPVNFDRWLFAF